MPLVQIEFAKSGPVAADLAARLAQSARTLTARHLGKRQDLTAVRVQRVDPADWYIGDAALGPGAASFSLRIAVTGTTNTKTEKAAYIAAIWDAFTDLLGPLRPESYVIVEDVPADGWGYGGQTQERRHVAGVIERERQETAVATAYRTLGVR